MAFLTPHKNIQNYRLQKADHQQHEHCREVEHSDRRYKPLYGPHDRVGDLNNEGKKRFLRKHKPGSDKPQEDKEHKHAKQSVQNKAKDDLRIAGHHTGRQTIDNKKSITDNLCKKVSNHEPDKHCQQRSQPRVDAVHRKKSRRRINPRFRKFSDLKAETSGLAKWIWVGVIRDKPQQQYAKKDAKKAPGNKAKYWIN